MSEHSIAQTVATEAEATWYFTFGTAHKHPTTGENLGQAYVAIPGTYHSARETMLLAFGQKWSHQYESAERAGIARWGLHEVEVPPPADKEDDFDDDPWRDDLTAAVEPSTTETADEPVPTVAQEIAIGLRALADMLDANPDLGDDDTYLRYMFAPLNVYTANRAAVARFARAAMAAGIRVGKHQGDKWAGIDIPFGERVALHVFVEREEICERVVTGTEEVTKEVPDPVALAAVPKVTVTETVEQVEWICRPLLAESVPPAGA